MKKKLKALISMVTLATMAFSTTVSALTVDENNISASATTVTTQKRSIGYYADWAIYEGEGYCNPENVPAKYLTHLNVAFTGVNKDGTLLMLDKDANFGHPLGHAGVTWGDINGGIVNDLQNVRKANPNLKLGFSIGGWSLSGNFTWVARDASKRKVFAKEIAELLDYTNFDFIDIDWEYPAAVRQPDNVDLKHDQGNPDAIPEDKQNYVLMLQEIRNELNALSAKTGKKYEISIAINMSHEKTEIGIDVPKIFSIIDFANVMTYDANGAWSDISGHQTALYDNPNDPWAGKGFTVDSSIKNFLKLGAPSNKLVVGAAYYTRGWERVSNDVPDPSLPGLYGKATPVNRDADGYIGYGAWNDKPVKEADGGRCAGNWAWRNRDLLHAKYPGLVEYWDDTAKAPYLYNKDTGAFFTYDNKRSIAEKTKYVNEHNLGGIITWMVSNDLKTASGQNDDLTKAIYDGLYQGSSLPVYEVKDAVTDAKANITTSKQDWSDASKLNIQLINNGKLTSTGSLMPKTAEQAAKTIKNAKVYIRTTNGVSVTAINYPCPPGKQEGNYFVIDFAESYDLKNIRPSQTTSFSVNLNKAIKDLEGIQEIFITQRMYKTAPEFGKTILYSAGPIVYDKEDVNEDGVINVVDMSLVASKYNKKSTDTDYIVRYDVNADKIIDMYDIVLVAKKLSSSGGGGGTVDPEEPTATEWAVGVAYKVGDVVSYNGKNYKCINPHTSLAGWTPTAVASLWQAL